MRLTLIALVLAFFNHPTLANEHEGSSTIDQPSQRQTLRNVLTQDEINGDILKARRSATFSLEDIPLEERTLTLLEDSRLGSVVVEGMRKRERHNNKGKTYTPQGNSVRMVFRGIALEKSADVPTEAYLYAIADNREFKSAAPISISELNSGKRITVPLFDIVETDFRGTVKVKAQLSVKWDKERDRLEISDAAATITVTKFITLVDDSDNLGTLTGKRKSVARLPVDHIE